MKAEPLVGPPVATKIAQLEDAGTEKEREKTPGKDSGYLWRWHSYWRFQETPEGVVVECETISLSRSIPWAFRWLTNLITGDLPKDYLKRTLTAVHDGFVATVGT